MFGAFHFFLLRHACKTGWIFMISVFLLPINHITWQLVLLDQKFMFVWHMKRNTWIHLVVIICQHTKMWMKMVFQWEKQRTAMPPMPPMSELENHLSQARRPAKETYEENHLPNSPNWRSDVRSWVTVTVVKLCVIFLSLSPGRKSFSFQCGLSFLSERYMWRSAWQGSSNRAVSQLGSSHSANHPIIDHVDLRGLTENPLHD